MSSLGITIGQSRRREVAANFYPTPPEGVRALLSVETFDGSIHEPACGQGHISCVLEAAGHEVISTDLNDWAYGDIGIDFLQQRVKLLEPQYRFANSRVRPFVYSAKVTPRSCSRPLQRAITDFAADQPFAVAQQKLLEHYGFEIGESTIRATTGRATSFCQRCQMLHDAEEHRRQRWLTLRMRKALGDLFLGRYPAGLG
jgi:hypothetical protein